MIERMSSAGQARFFGHGDIVLVERNVPFC